MKCKNIPAEFHRERVGVASSADARFTHNKIEEWIDNLDIHAYGRLYPKIVDAPPVLDLDFLSILSLKLNWFVAASTELAIIPHNLEHHHLVYTPGSIIDYFCSDLDHHAIISQLIASLICQ